MPYSAHRAAQRGPAGQGRRGP